MAAPSVDDHIEALEADEARHNLILWLLQMAKRDGEARVSIFELGDPGACAVRIGPHNIVLGDLSETQCRRLAVETRSHDYPGVVGQEVTAQWFADAARDVGTRFGEPVPQRIYALDHAPQATSADGAFRPIEPADVPLIAEWILAFSEEAVPHDPRPQRVELERTLAGEPYYLWEYQGEPVSMAKIARTTRHCAAISLVYTPPERRGRGFAAAVTAGTVRAAMEQGKTVACLYTDLRNPVSNRVYTKIGFKPVCDSRFYPRCFT